MTNLPVDPVDQIDEAVLKLNPTIIDAYLNAQMWVEVGVRLNSVEVEPRYWIALFQGGQGEYVLGLPNPPRLVEGDPVHGRDKEPVFVGVDKFVQKSQRGHLGPVRVHRAWLYGFNELEDVKVGDPLKADRLAIVSLVEPPLGADRELCLVCGDSVIELHELERQVVKGGAHVRQEITEYGRQIGVQNGKPIYPIDVLRGLTVKLTNNTVGTRSQDRSLAQVTYVKTGSVQFRISAAKSGIERGHA
jgi:hypothetical protein